MTPLGYKNLKLEISNPVLWGLKPSIMRLKLSISETQTRYFWDSKWVSLRLKHSIFEIQDTYSETQNGYFWDSNTAFLRFKMGILRLKMGISETQTRHFEIQKWVFWDSKWVSLRLKQITIKPFLDTTTYTVLAAIKWFLVFINVHTWQWRLPNNTQYQKSPGVHMHALTS